MNTFRILTINDTWINIPDWLKVKNKFFFYIDRRNVTFFRSMGATNQGLVVMGQNGHVTIWSLSNIETSMVYGDFVFLEEEDYNAVD